MSPIEIKSEIHKTLDQVPEALLQDILDFVRDLQTQSPERIKRVNNLRKILSEDENLLKRLAQ